MKKNIFEKYNKGLGFIIRNIIILLIGLLLLNYFNVLDITLLLPLRYCWVIMLYLVSFFVFSYYQGSNKKKRERVNEIVRYIFLFVLFLITLNLVNFVVQSPSRHIFPLSDMGIYLNHMLFVSGVFLLLINKDHLDQIEKEEKNEKDNEEKREKEFEYKFKKINRIPILRDIVKWMYKEGWWYSIGLVLIFVLFFGIRIGAPILYKTNTPDEFLHMASAKSLLEEGKLAQFYQYGEYTRGLIITFLTYISFSLFGVSYYSAKLVPVLLGTVSFLLISKIGKNLIKNKLIFLSFLLAYILNPLTIFNHYTIRMYILYEALLVAGIFLLVKTHDFVEQKNLKGGLISLSFLFLFNMLNWIWESGDGKYILPLISALGLFIIVIGSDFSELFYIPGKFNKFLSKKNNRLVFLLPLIIFGVLKNWDKIESLITREHFLPTNWDYWNLFFEYLFVLTTFAAVALTWAISSKRLKIKFLSITLLLLMILHLSSSLEIQHWRVIAYLMPLFLLISFLGVFLIFVIYSKKSSVLNFVYLLFVIIITLFSYKKMVPDNYLQLGPTIPEYSDYAHTNMVSTSNFINNNFNNDYIIIEALRGYNLPSLKIYNIRVDYKLDLRQDEHFDFANPSPSDSWYVTENGDIRPIYMNSPVINSMTELQSIMQNNRVVFIISDEVAGGHYLIDGEDLEYIKQNVKYQKTFIGVQLYWN